ncbi:MAG: hypothetical protein IIA45_03145 [Bacteroidetes bacterium]|nr:hypothetical protein [Bacteroidota bacterium]
MKMKRKKTRADDYLKELITKNNKNWLSPLIEKVAVVRGVPDEDFLDKIYGKFLVAQELQEEEENDNTVVGETESLEETNAEKNFILKSLKHKRGVNALEENVEIPFHPKLTVIYGKNGSGKSGFVRILKKIAGSRTQEEIWQNIHNSQTQNECSAEFKYIIDEKEDTYLWNGESKISPFDQMAIFDGKSIPIYLNKSIDFSYQPYGFELFSSLSSSLRKLQVRLESEIQEDKEEQPDISEIFYEYTTIGKFIESISPETDVASLTKLPKWNQEKKKLLVTKRKELKGLENISQQLELLRVYHQRLEALESILVQIQSDLSVSSVKGYLGLVTKYASLKKKLSVKKGETLEDYNILEMNSDEWQGFIEAGEEYTELIHGDEYPEDDDHCLYCKQKLSKKAQKLIKLYRKLFEEDETTDLDNIKDEINDILIELQNTSYVSNFPYAQEQFAKFINKRTITNAFAAMKSADLLAQAISTCIEEKKLKKFKSPKIAQIISSIRRVKINKIKEITSLEKIQRNLKGKSKEINEVIAELEDTQLFFRHRIKVKEYIESEQWLDAASSAQSELNTRSVTELGNRAWRELVSDSFKKAFEAEAENLNAPTINLEFRGEYGSQKREKNIEGLSGIDQFLSEGEQKAVSLSDFFAELSMEHKESPIIFDDPANSFDQDRKKKIADRIAQESERYQVIVFTHDLMFASYIHRQVEKKDGSIDSSKANFHNLEAEAGKVGKLTENYYPAKTKFDVAIKKVENIVRKIEELSGENRADALKGAYGSLRGAVEKAVEERIFGGVITRWSEQIQLHNVSRASLDEDKLETAQQMHLEFSAYIDSHDQSDEMIQHASPTITSLKADIERVKIVATR